MTSASSSSMIRSCCFFGVIVVLSMYVVSIINESRAILFYQNPNNPLSSDVVAVANCTNTCTSNEDVSKLQGEIKRLKKEISVLVTTQMKHVSEIQEKMKKIKNDTRHSVCQESKQSYNERTESTKRNLDNYKKSKRLGIPYVQEDHPLFNGIKIGNFSRDAIQKIYPKVDIDECMKYSNDSTGRYVDTSDWYEIERSINDVQHNKKLINFSLFRKNLNYPFGPLPQERRRNWENKYVIPLSQTFNTSHENGHSKYFNDCDFHLYLANDLQYLIDDGTITKHENLTIHIMKTSGIGSSPGTLWRFLGLNHPNYDVTAACDIDDLIKRDSFEMAAKKVLSADNDFNLVTRIISIANTTNATVGCFNFPVILGGFVITKPSALPFDIKKVISGFTRLVQDRLSIKTPLTFSDNEPTTFWNVGIPTKTHANGWGANIFAYGFDERFLKHVVYYTTNVSHINGGCYKRSVYNTSI